CQAWGALSRPFVVCAETSRRWFVAWNAPARQRRMGAEPYGRVKPQRDRAASARTRENESRAARGQPRAIDRSWCVVVIAALQQCTPRATSRSGPNPKRLFPMTLCLDAPRGMLFARESNAI